MDFTNDKLTLLIDTRVLFSDYGELQQRIYAKQFIYYLLESLWNEKDLWEVFLVGYQDLMQNLISLEFSNFRIDEYKGFLNFFKVDEKTKDKSIEVRWKSVDNIIYEIEPDYFISFNFQDGLPTIPKLQHTYKDLKTIVYVHNVDEELLTAPIGRLKFKKRAEQKLYKRTLDGLEGAHKITVPNKFVRDDIAKIFPERKSEIDIFYPGIEELFMSDPNMIKEEELLNFKKIYGLEDTKYIVYDHTLEDSQEVERLTAFIKSMNENKKAKFKVVLSGNDFYKGIGNEIEARTIMSGELVNALRELDLLQNIISTGLIELEDTVLLLAGAEGYLHISTYNSFSFGPIQAIAMGLPAFVDNEEVMAKNLKRYVHIIDSTDPNGAVKKMVEILNDEDIKNQIYTSTRRVIKRFSWEGAANRFIKEIKRMSGINTDVDI